MRFRAKPVENPSKLKSDITAAKDHNLFRKCFKVERFIRGDSMPAIPGHRVIAAFHRLRSKFVRTQFATNCDVIGAGYRCEPPISSAPAFSKVIGKCSPARQAQSFRFNQI